MEEELISNKHRCIEITYPWNRIYSREFLIGNNLFFNDLYGGDVIHTIRAINACKRMMNVDKCYHFYRIDNINSDTKSANTAKKLYEMNFVLAKALEDVLPEVDIAWRPLIAECCPWRINHTWKQILKLPIYEQRKLYHMISEDKEMFPFLSKYADRPTKFVLTYPKVVRCISPTYRIMRCARELLLKHNHS